MITIIFGLAVIAVYHFINLPIFSLDLTRQAKDAMFYIREDPSFDSSILLFNIGKLEPDELQVKIDSILITQPRKVGINLCHFDIIPKALIENYASNEKVIFANCRGVGLGTLSEIITEGNQVTHFKTDGPDYFEFLLTGFKGRGNKQERINYGPKTNYYVNKVELAASDFWFNPEFLKDKTLLVGYMGDYLSDTIYDYKNCRRTPLNTYGADGNLPDMYDIDISAHIIRTINYNDFINEVNLKVKVLIILAFSLLNVFILTFAKTRWTIVNLLIATILFILLSGIASTWLLFYLFHKRYYLELDELPIILLVITVFTVILNLNAKKESS